MLERCVKQSDRDGNLDWDAAARRYLAIVALDRAAVAFNPSLASSEVTRALEKLQKQLDLPATIGTRKGLLDSPYRFDPEQIKAGIKSVEAALPRP